MTTLLEQLKEAYLSCAGKRVTRTDKKKGAYVLTNEMVAVMEAANSKPARDSAIPIHVIGSTQVLKSSYYNSASTRFRPPPGTEDG